MRLRMFSAATSVTLVAVAALFVVAVPACKEKGPPLPKGASAKADPAGAAPKMGDTKLPGRVLMGDKQWPASQFIGHDARMDLRTHCLSARDAAIKQAKTKPDQKVAQLCFDQSGKRERVKAIRVDFAKGGRIGTMMAHLRANNEAAHFMVEGSGSVYQVLDLSLAARRDGSYQADEVRVLSANETGHKALIGALTELFGKLPVTTLPLKLAQPQPPKPPQAPKKTPAATKETKP